MKSNKQIKQEIQQINDFLNLLGAPQSYITGDEESIELNFRVNRDTFSIVCKSLEETQDALLKKIKKPGSITSPSIDSKEYQIIQNYHANPKRGARKRAISELSNIRNISFKTAETYFDKYKDDVKKRSIKNFSFLSWLKNK